MHPNLGSLAAPIMVDGLYGGTPRTDQNGNPEGGMQYAIMPENELIALERVSAGILSVKNSGPMNGIVANANVEYHFLDFLFVRTGLNYTKKVQGGDTEAFVAGVKWLDYEWRYESYVIPSYVGTIISVPSGRAGFYLGLGVHYFQGGWGAKVNTATELVDVMLPNDITVNNQTKPASRYLLGQAPRPGFYGENIFFEIKGWGLNWIIGTQVNLFHNFFLFTEIETLLNGQYQTSTSKSTAGMLHISPYPTYPITLGGTIYRFGLKYRIF